MHCDNLSLRDAAIGKYLDNDDDADSRVYSKSCKTQSVGNNNLETDETDHRY